MSKEKEAKSEEVVNDNVITSPSGQEIELPKNALIPPFVPPADPKFPGAFKAAPPADVKAEEEEKEDEGKSKHVKGEKKDA